MPFDLVPRLITPGEWQHIERGLEQRVRALNLFLHDVYHEQRILSSGTRPRRSWSWAPRATGASSGTWTCPLGVYTHIVGSDLVRDRERRSSSSSRTTCAPPPGVSYVVENRRVLKRVWPQIFRDYDVRPVEGYPQDLLDVLRDVAPPSVDEPTVVLLTPGRLQLGLLRARLPGQGDGRRAGAGLATCSWTTAWCTCAPPAAGSGSTSSTAGSTTTSSIRWPSARLPARRARAWWPPTAWAGSAWPTPSAPAWPTTRRSTPTSRRSSATTWARSPILPNVQTYLAAEPDDLAYIAGAPRRAGGQVGQRERRLRHADRAARLAGASARSSASGSLADPRGYIAQPTLALSRHPCWVDDHFEGRHVDLRPFVLFGRRGARDARAA